MFSEEEILILKRLENRRRLTRFRTVFILILIVLIFSVPVVGEVCFKFYPAAIIIASVVLGSGFAFLIWYFILRHCLPIEQISLEFKKLVLPALMKKLDAEWKVAYTHRLTVDDLAESGIYKDRMNSMIRDDYFSGPAGKNNAEVFQVYLRIHATQVTRGRRTSSKISIDTNYFSGLFFRVNFQTHFPGRIWIFPIKRKSSGETDDWAETTGKYYANKKDVSRIFSGNPDFDAAFFLVSDKPSVTQSILTPERVLNLQHIANEFPFNCAFSFVNNHVFAMIGFDYDLFDIESDTTIDEKYIDACYNDLQRIRMVAGLLAL